MRRIVCGVLAALALSVEGGHACAQAADPMQTQIEQVVRRCLKEDGTPSASVAAVREGKVAYVAAGGLAVISPAQKATPATRYQLASISKMFVAQAVLLLVAEGKLSLEDRVSRWFPTLTQANEVTVRELLNHTSGYVNHYPESYPAGEKGRAAAPAYIIDKWGHHPLLFEPGTQYHYSNLEYEMAGRIVELVSGVPLFRFLQERVFALAGMTSAIDLDTIPDGSRALATGYVQVGLAPLEAAPYEGPGWSFGSGQVVTTAEDVARWDADFLGGKVLPAAEAKEQVTPATLKDGSSYPAGLGIFMSHGDGPLRFYHSGQGLGFEAVNFIYPGQKLAVVVLTNTNVKATCLKIAEELLYLLLAPTAEERKARAVFDGLRGGTLEGSGLSPDLRAHLSAKVLEDYRSSLAPLGPVESFVALRPSTNDGMETRDYEVRAGGHLLKLHLLVQSGGLLRDAVIAPVD